MKECSNANLYLPASIRTENARRLIQIATLNRQDVSGLNNCLDLFDFIKENGIKINAVEKGDVVYDLGEVQITALSPSNDTIKYYNSDYETYLDTVEQRLQSGNLPYKLPMSKEFNHHSIVLKVIYSKYNLLLCGDLEVHKKSELGLTPLLKELSKFETKFTLFKVPHHGSHNGVTTNKIEEVVKSDFDKWLSVLDAGRPRFAMTSKGIVPQEKMVKEMLAITSKSFITTNPKTRKVEPPSNAKKEVIKTGLDINYLSKHYGMIRFWFSDLTNELKFEMRNEACHLSELLNSN